MFSTFSFSNNTVGFLIDGNLNQKTVDNLHQQILERLDAFEKINLYMEDTGIESFSLPAVIDEILFKIKHNDKFHKIALVTNHKWIHLCGGIENLFLDIKIKSFDIKDRLEAITWIAEIN